MSKKLILSNFIEKSRMIHGDRYDYTKSFLSDSINKEGTSIIKYDRNGVDGKEAFFIWDSFGKITTTKHPNLLYILLKTKGSCNLHIKMYAEDRANCNFNRIEFRALCIHFKSPKWFREAVENQKFKFCK